MATVSIPDGAERLAHATQVAQDVERNLNTVIHGKAETVEHRTSFPPT